MNEIILLIILGAFSIIGLWYIYRTYDDTNDVKKIAAVFIGIMVIASTMFLIFSLETRNIAMMNGEQSQSTLAILLSWNNGGYSPYVKESWGKTGSEDDFDYDGVKNSWDHDADNDGVEDVYEQPTRFNPYQPDIGIENIGVKWVSEDTLIIESTPVQDITGVDFVVTLYVNNIIRAVEEYQFGDMISFTVDVDPNIKNIVELHCEGRESDYANKANNLISYTIPSGIMGVVGQWYYDLENQVQGVIRNSPLFQSSNSFFSDFENLFRSVFAGIPLLFWFLVIISVVIVLVVVQRRRRKGKKPLFMRNKRSRVRSGDVKIQFY